MSESTNGHVPFMLGKRAPLPVHSCNADCHQFVRDHGCQQLQTIDSLHSQLPRKDCELTCEWLVGTMRAQCHSKGSDLLLDQVQLVAPQVLGTGFVAASSAQRM